MRKTLNNLVFVIVAGGVLAAGASAYVLGLHLQTVTSGSMAPAVGAGDVAITAPVTVADLRVGDVIAFYPPGKDSAVLHRLVSIDGSLVTTKGDANGAEDPWGAVTLRGDTAYRLVGVVPLVGWLTAYRGPMLLVAGLLVAFLLAQEVRKEFRARRPSPA